MGEFVGVAEMRERYDVARNEAVATSTACVIKNLVYHAKAFGFILSMCDLIKFTFSLKKMFLVAACRWRP